MNQQNNMNNGVNSGIQNQNMGNNVATPPVQSTPVNNQAPIAQQSSNNNQPVNPQGNTTSSGEIGNIMPNIDTAVVSKTNSIPTVSGGLPVNNNANNNPQAPSVAPTTQVETSTPKFEFNSKETVLKKNKAEKESNPLVALIIVACILAFVYFLPTIKNNLGDRDLLSLITGGGKVTTTPEPSETANPEQPEEEKKDNRHSFQEAQIVFNIGDLMFTNFVKDNTNGKYELSFTIANNGESIFEYTPKYYITFYNNDSEIYNALVFSYDVLAPNGATEMTVPISENAFERGLSIEIREIKEEDYPKITLSNEENGYNTYVCKKDFNELKYYFQDDLLKKVTETHKEDIETSPDFETNLPKYRDISSNYKKIENFESTFIETDKDFSMINNINLDTVKDNEINALKQYQFFKFNENVNIVSFEMKGLGYTCS